MVGADQSEGIEVLVAEVRNLIAGLQEANSNGSAGGIGRAYLDEVTRGIVAHLDTLPDRLARAISAALAKQHQLIMNDVHAAMQDLASQLKPSRPDE